MRRFLFAALLLPLCLSPLAASAEESRVAEPQPPALEPGDPGTTGPGAPSATAEPSEKPQQDLAQSLDPKVRQDQLFDSLRRERDPDKAKEIASQIIANWNDSGSATVNLLMQWAAKAVAEKKNAAALDFLDEVTVLDPSYTEGWNRRATLHYTMGDTRKSMADINQVLQRDARHFPAIAGMATILMENGEDELALRAWERFLAIYPAERDAQENVTRLSEKIAGSRT
ncbi:tetratricopeptide repeat protein [Rhizobium helianthi]|uniref:Tetratricopeptide repeat protein n=1 Tax=Rhizobium helianthi TaxID=1132695 RepID=A0ABW4M3P0_9HYPH